MTRADHRRKPIRTASLILREIFNEMAARKMSLPAMAASMDRHENRLSEWRRGVVEPGVMAVEEMAQHLGYRIELVPIDVDSGL